MADISLPLAKAGKRVSGLVLLMFGIAAFLLIFLLIPAGTVIYVAFTEKGTGALTLLNFVDFFSNDLFKRSFVNSLYVSIMSVIWASLFALPLAVITTALNSAARC